MTDIHHPDTPRNRGDHDAPHMSPVTPAEDIRTIMINRVSWGAVLAGTVVALVTQLLLNLLGLGLGAASLNPADGSTPNAGTFSIIAGIWWAVSGIIASFVGGYAAGRMAGKPKESTAGWHGLTTWAVTTLVIFYLLTTTIGNVLGGVLNTVGGVASTVTQSAATAAAPAVDDPEAQQAAGEAVENLQEQAQEVQQQATEAAGQLQEQATEVAETASTAATTGALVAFVALLLGALAAWFGGRRGAVDPTISARVGLGTRV